MCYDYTYVVESARAHSLANLILFWLNVRSFKFGSAQLFDYRFIVYFGLEFLCCLFGLVFGDLVVI